MNKQKATEGEVMMVATVFSTLYPGRHRDDDVIREHVNSLPYDARSQLIEHARRVLMSMYKKLK